MKYIIGHELSLNKAEVTSAYDKQFNINKGVTVRQRMIIIETEELGKVCFGSRAEWVSMLSIGDIIDVKLLIKDYTEYKKLYFANKPRLIHKY